MLKYDGYRVVNVRVLMKLCFVSGMSDVTASVVLLLLLAVLLLVVVVAVVTVTVVVGGGILRQ
jgi:hypothetical protein